MNLDQLSHPITSDAELEERLRLLSEIKRTVQQVESQLDNAISSAKSRADQELTWRVGQDDFHASDICNAVTEEVRQYAEGHRKRLFGKLQSAKLRGGNLKFRKVVSKIELQDGVETDQVLKTLRERYPEAMRIKEEINFVRIRDDLFNDRLSSAELDALGLQVVETPEKFSIDVI